MKQIQNTLVIFILFISTQGFSDGPHHFPKEGLCYVNGNKGEPIHSSYVRDGTNHSHHPKHNMVLFGTAEIFASHLVYKVPHNYQVIIRINFDQFFREKYIAERLMHPNDEIIYLLDEMDIKEIASMNMISGTIFRNDPSGKKFEIATNVQLSRKQFELIYFDEVPLSLGRSNESFFKMTKRLSFIEQQQ